MGDRAQVHLTGKYDYEVYLYTHWGARGLPMLVRSALARAADESHDRLLDGPYVARIIFSEMIREDINGTTGFAIDNMRRNDVYRVVNVDIENLVVEFDGYDNTNSGIWGLYDYIDPEFAPDIASIEA